jgi:hypothetical protein
MRLRAGIIVLLKLELAAGIEVQKALYGDDVLHFIVKHVAGERFILQREDHACVHQEQHHEHRNVIHREPHTQGRGAGEVHVRVSRIHIVTVKQGSSAAVVRKHIQTEGVTCWDEKQARAIVGTMLDYEPDGFRWNGKYMRNLGTKVHEINANDIALYNRVTLSQLGIPSPMVKEIEIQHPDAQVFDKTSDCCSAVPGEAVIMKSSSVLIFSLYGVFYEASR